MNKLEDTSPAVEPTTRARAIVGALNHLISANLNMEKTYALAAADARDRALKDSLSALEQERAKFVRELGDVVTGLKATPINEGSAGGALHRAWMGLREAIEGRSDRLVLEECISAEESARQKYVRALYVLSSARVDDPVRRMVDAQHRRVLATLEELRGGLTGSGPTAARKA